MKSKKTKSIKKDIQLEVTEKIISLIEKGVKPWKCPWVNKDVNPIPANFSTGSSYSGINIMLLWMESIEKGFKNNLWLTYKQAQSLGGNVRKGEKSVSCIFVKPVQIEDKEKSTKDEKAIKDIMILNSFSLFNIDQIDGLDLPIEPDKQVNYHGEAYDKINEIAKKYFESNGVKFEEGGNQAYYSPSLDLIKLPKTFISSEGYAATFAHEMVHSTGIEKRLNRFSRQDEDFKTKKESYAAEELVAEIGSCMITAQLGIDADHENHASYIDNWLSCLKKDKRFIFKAAADANKAVKLILNFENALSANAA